MRKHLGRGGGGGGVLFPMTGLLMKSFQPHKETVMKSSEVRGDGGATPTSQDDRYSTCWACSLLCYHLSQSGNSAGAAAQHGGAGVGQSTEELLRRHIQMGQGHRFVWMLNLKTCMSLVKSKS